MGHTIEINDTLKLARGVSLPSGLSEGGTYPFRINGRRLYNLAPVRVFLVEEIDGRWNYIGHALIHELTINADKNETSGRFTLIKIYDEPYRRAANLNESPAGRGYEVTSERLQPDR